VTRALGPRHIEGELRPDVSSVDREVEEARAQLASAEARIAFLGESNHRVAREKYGEALRIYRELGCDGQVAETLFRLGEVYRELGDAAQAIEVLHEALNVFRGLQAKERVGYALLELGRLLSSRVRGSCSRRGSISTGLRISSGGAGRGGGSQRFI